MKIGILTFYWSNDNYGQLLQCYALQKFLRDKGHDAFLIRYFSPFDKTPTPLWLKCLKVLNPIKILKILIYRLRDSKIKKQEKDFDRHFENFRNKYIKKTEQEYKSYLNLKEKLPTVDMLIVGSDQVWNHLHEDIKKYENLRRAYFLDIGDSDLKRVAYAASWGVAGIPHTFAEIVAPLLRRFDYIGVREKNGVAICEKCGRSDAEWVCDPTLLLRGDIYRKLYSENPIRKPVGKFILLYILNNKFSFDIQSVYDFAASKNLAVIYVTGNGKLDKYPKFFATIPEWLYLIDNAEYIITNSFHCGVFSTIFHKQFGIVPLTGSDEGMNTRFSSLFELLGTGDRYISDIDFSVLDSSYSVKEVEVSDNFLKVLGES